MPIDLLEQKAGPIDLLAGKEETLTIPAQMGSADIDEEKAKALGIPTMKQKRDIERIVSMMPYAMNRGFSQGLRQTGQGIGQLSVGLYDELMTPEIMDSLGIANRKLPEYTQDVMKQREEFNQQYAGIPGVGFSVGAGEMYPYMMIPGVGGGGTAAQSIKLGLLGAGIGGSQFAETPEQRMKNLERGGAFGASIPIAIKAASMVGAPAKKAINAIRGQNLTDDGLVALSEKHDVPLSYGDIKGGAVVPKAEVLLESAPVVGTGKFRAMQNVRSKEAAQRLINNLNQFQGDDWAIAMQSSLKNQAKLVKDTASQYYDDLERIAGSDPVKTPNMNNAARAIIAKIKEKPPNLMSDVDRNIITKMQNYIDDPQASFSVLRQLRSDFGDEIDDLYTGANGVIGKKGADKLTTIKKALEKDMESFAQEKGGKTWQAWKRADQYYREKVVPFKDKAVANAIKSAEPDKIYAQFIKRTSTGGAGGDRAQRFYDLLDENGRAAVRYGMVSDAYRVATKSQDFSPAQFAKSLEDISKARNKFFSGQQRDELNGFIKLMQHAKRGGQYAENPPTGQRNVLLLLAGGGTLVDAGTTAGVAASSLALKTLFTTKAGRNFLLASSKLEPGTPQMQKAIEQISEYVVKAITPSLDNMQPQAPQPTGQGPGLFGGEELKIPQPALPSR